MSARILIVAEHDGTKLNPSTAKCVTCAHTLAGAEITVAVFLLVCSGLLLESLKAVERLSTGFDPQGVMTETVALPRISWPSIWPRLPVKSPITPPT